MAAKASMVAKQFNIVVAACSNRGIGINGQLPWNLKGDMAFFKKITSTTKTQGRQNVVIMGRKTWDSIPAKFRPLANRINVIISRNMQESPEGAHLVRSLDEALTLVTSEPLADTVDELFIIGGSAIYEIAFKSPYCHRIYFTDVMTDIQCDTFLPHWDSHRFKKISIEEVDEEVKTENGINYKFEVYEKQHIDVLVAFCENRGIALKNNLPWPPLQKDYDHYIGMMNSVKQKGKKNVIIKGRLTWEATTEAEASLPNIINIVVSNSWKELPKHVYKLVGSFEEAVETAMSSPFRDNIDNVYILGGATNFKMAIESNWLRRLYITRILETFSADVFMPEFEHCCRKIRDASSDNSLHEENNIKYLFEVYEKDYKV